ncbi:MAG TPA: hypothetical protein VHR38_07395 [Solirubrobacterales bacterium]|nr:hypothetical protein [Solirubrobacterales bacterium]
MTEGVPCHTSRAGARPARVNSFLPVQGGAGIGVSAHASTLLDAGPFVGIVGGLLMVAGALGLAGEAPEAPTNERASSATVDAAT